MPQNIEKSAPPQIMEIKTTYEQPIVKKEVSSPPLGSPHLPLVEGAEHQTMASINPTLADSSIHHNILQLKQQQQIQRELLLEQYRQQQQQLAQVHEKQLQLHMKHQHEQHMQQQQQQLAEHQEKQLQQHIKGSGVPICRYEVVVKSAGERWVGDPPLLTMPSRAAQSVSELDGVLVAPVQSILDEMYLEEQTQKAEEERAERQRIEEEKIEAIKKKKDDQCSAVASNEVKKFLQEKILKKIRDNDQNAVGDPSNYRNWPPAHLLHNPEDFKLRKTASEPNICLKAKLKTRITHDYCRASPIGSRRNDYRSVTATRRRPTTHVSEAPMSSPPPTADSASTPDSEQSSPPNGLPTSRSSAGSTPIHEEGGGSPYGATQGSCSDLSHPFSSLPNISLGRPPHSSQAEGSKLASVSETEMVNAARAGMPITGHVLPSTLPNYPTLPGIDSEVCSANSSPHRTRRIITTMDTTVSPVTLTGTTYHIGGHPLTEQPARLNRTSQRPLGRTQSAPLPLGHPMLQGAPPSFMPTGHGAPATPQQQHHQFDIKHEHHPSNIIKQHIRQAVLKRTGSKNHVENVEEETEAAVAEAIANEKSPEVIDLTEGMRSPVYHHDRFSFLHHPWDNHSLKPPNVYSMVQPFGPRSGSHLARPLSRAFSSPLVTLSCTGSHQEPISISKQGATTGLAYDSLMQMHQCICGANSPHPENGSRIQAVWNRLQETGLVSRCQRVESRRASLEEIQSCHSEAHTVFFGTINRPQLDFRKLGEMPIRTFVKLPCRGIGVDSDTTWNELHTSASARLAVGCTIDLAFKVAAGELRNGYAVVRPPGHHAEYQQAMGFCFFNTVAITARRLQQKFGLQKILILDWDIHHGNGTQATFYDDPNVLYLSIHRYDNGSFFPGTGAPTEVGVGAGYGFTVNLAWSGGLDPGMGDAEYLAAFRSVVMPIAKVFNPEIVLVSAGFDATDRHPSTLGGYKVSPACFGYMTSCLMTLARGKVVLVLEGGYQLESISSASEACVRALLGDQPPPLSEHEVSRRPCPAAIETLENVITTQTKHWPVVLRTVSTVGLSHLEAQGCEEEQETVSAMASLRVDHHTGHTSSPEPVTSQTPSRSPHDEEEPMEEEME